MKPWAMLVQQLNVPPPPGPSFYSGRCLYCGSPLPFNRKKFCTDACCSRHNNVLRPKTRAGRAEIVRSR
jgi:hypothetical protein